MAARIRPTVPHKGLLPHREHRSPKGRVPDYNFKRSRAIAYRLLLEEALEADIEKQLRDIREDESTP